MSTDGPGGPSLQEVAGKSGRAATALAIRQVTVLGLNITGSVVFARLLAPSEYAFYAVALFLFGFFGIAADAGLGTALIRQQAEPSARQIHAVVTVQFAVTAGIAAAAWFLVPQIAGVAHGPPGSVWFVRYALLTVCLTPLHTAPLVALERRLSFGRVGAVNFAEAVAFNGTALIGIVHGYGIASFGAAMLAQEAVGAALLWVASPWRPRFAVREGGLRALAQFGVPYQAGAALSIAKDAVVPVALGWLLNASAVGYAQWAGQLAVVTLYATTILQRVYLPAFSRLQHDRIALGRLVQASSDAVNLLVAPFAVLVLVLARDITPLIFGTRWEPALPLFYLLWTANLIAPSAGPVISLVNSSGRSRFTLLLAAGWFIVLWVGVLTLVPWLGLLGFGVANIAVHCSSVVLFRAGRRLADYRLLPGFAGAWGCAVLAGTVVWAVRSVRHGTLIDLAADALVGVTVYAVVVYLFRGHQTAEFLRLFTGRPSLSSSPRSSLDPPSV